LVAYANILSGEAQGIATRTQALNSVRSFLAWAASLDGVHLRPEQIKAILKIPKGCVLTPYEVLTQAEIGRFLGAARASGPRDYALMLVFLGGGLRVSEVVALAGKDLREDGDGEPFLHIRGGKGQKDRFVPILREVSGAVEAYLLAGKRSLGTDATVFLRDSTRAAGEPMDARACGDLVHQFCREAQISKRISPHSLRHTYAIACLRHRRNLMAVSKLLGHSLLTTTQRYVNHLDLLEMREVVPGFLVGAQSD
jgi:integrase/recombinase XerD